MGGARVREHGDALASVKFGVGFLKPDASPSRSWPEAAAATRAVGTLLAPSRWRWCSARKLTTPAMRQSDPKTRAEPRIRSV